MEVNKIYLGDNREIMRQIPDDHIDLTITSPPYDDMRGYDDTYSGHFDFTETAKEIYRVTKPGGIVVWVVGDQTKEGDESGESFRQALGFREIGFKLYDTMIYKKNMYLPQNKRKYEQSFEYMFILAKLDKGHTRINTFNGLMEKTKYSGCVKSRDTIKSGSSSDKRAMHSSILGKTLIVKDEKLRSNIWDYNIGKYHNTKDMIAHDHPAIFPDQLAYDHIYSWSDTGDIILDPFCGSGTTCAMAKKLGRRYIGIEIVRKYYYIAVSRCE